jgi:YfiH family protein
MSDSLHIFENLKTAGFTAGIILNGVRRGRTEIEDSIRKRLPRVKKTILSPLQTHGTEIVFIDDGTNTDNINADGILSDSEEMCLTIRTADCVPILLADSSSGIFGAVHVGWRGLVAGIIEELTGMIADRGLRADSILIGLGPSIGKCCFETGDEVAILFDESSVWLKQQALLVDLKGAVMEKLTGAGIEAGNIENVDNCTVCSGDDYPSYRRTGDASSQMVSFIFGSG